MLRMFLACAVSFLLVFTLVACPDKTEEAADAAATELDAGAPAQPVAKTVAEVEPNEKSNQAMELKESALVNASLEAAADAKAVASDYYRLVVTTRQIARVELSGIAEEDVKLVIYDADMNKLLTLDSGSAGQGETYPNLSVDRGAYLQVVGKAGGKGGAYTLGVTLSSPVAGEEVESNDRYSLATPLKAGEPVKGWLSHRRDEDWYLLSLKDLAPGSVLRVDLTGVPDVRFEFLVAEQAQQTPLLTVKGAESGKGIVVRNFGVPAPAGAAAPEGVFLVVKSAWVPGSEPKKFVQTFNVSAPYTLSVSAEAGGEDLEREPDDDAAHAIALLDGQKVRGYLSAPNDVDWYKIEVERPSLLSAELSALNRVDLVLFVVNPEKKDEAKGFELCKINLGLVNEPETLTNCALQAGTNYLRIEGAWKSVDGKWVRDFENLDETYTLSVALRTDDGLEEREPNDAAEKATPIKLGSTLRGTLHPKGDVDQYLLDLSDQDGPVNALVECTGIPKLDIALTLLSGEKDEKGKPKELASSAKGKGEAREQIQKELLPGKYWILVRGAPATESNTRDQYLLTVSQP